MLRLIEKPEQVAMDHYLLRIESPSEQSFPGQFIEVRVGDNLNGPILRRPFSIFDHENGVISIVVKTVGRGTSLLASRMPGEIDAIGPLGCGFTLPRRGRVLIAGGGVGNAPLHFLARRAAERGCDVTVLYGARSRIHVFLADLFKKAARRFIVTTEDGSEGRKGLVTDAAAAILSEERFEKIYACGPAAMMRTLSSLAGSTPIEVSLENYFGCGIGLCYGCTVETTAGFRRACVEGPVFNGAEIRWDALPD